MKRSAREGRNGTFPFATFDERRRLLRTTGFESSRLSYPFQIFFIFFWPNYSFGCILLQQKHTSCFILLFCGPSPMFCSFSLKGWGFLNFFTCHFLKPCMTLFVCNDHHFLHQRHLVYTRVKDICRWEKEVAYDFSLTERQREEKTHTDQSERGAGGQKNRS